MQTFHERQGKKGQRKLVRVTNRFGDNYDSQHRAESRQMRSVVLQRDERRLFDDQHEPLMDAPFCGSVGVFIPVGGGAVSLGKPGSNRRVLHFAPSGHLASAHF
jgi:hypothetical protein